ncbi:MAG TPA: ATP-binding protein [Acidimicrobiia bacterium]|jgi:anti-sigma regulatory factor (Ser/Thr protein kinase)|nr:ATP-binding protein [Acidimicrobiia bacterium]
MLLQRACHPIANSPAAPAEARRYVGEALAGAPVEVVDAVTLMVSELATNCVRYVDTDFTVSIERSASQVRVDVADEGGGVVSLRRPQTTDPTGRGLNIVDKLSDEWGVDANADHGKNVWFTLGLDRRREPAC